MGNPTDGALFSLENLFGGEAVQGMREMMRDATPFKIIVVVRISS